MCLYPRLIDNPKYKRNKKNGGVIPAIPDQRVRAVPIGCGTCLECRKQKSREWQVRLHEDIKEHKNGKFVTLTFSTESLRKLAQKRYEIMKTKRYKFSKPPYRQIIHKGKGKIIDTSCLKGYDLDNAIVTRAVRLFLERWRKKYKKSLRHWLITELGHGTTEHIHLHGIVWCDDLTELEKIWGYGIVWKGYEINGILQNYVNNRTVNYIVKYVSKMDKEHLNYKPIILTSAGIGRYYETSRKINYNRYAGDKTHEYYRSDTGHKIAMPIYWRNKAYTDHQRELLWLKKLDEGIRYVCGERIRITENDLVYYNVLEYHRDRTERLGYPRPEFIWKKKEYEEQRRKLLHKQRLKIGSTYKIK